MALGPDFVHQDTSSGAMTVMQDSLAVIVRDFVKAYGSRRVVDGVSFGVKQGEVFGVLGPNGAGKTTTIETLEGYRRPDRGMVRVLGLDPLHDARSLTPRIGGMPQDGGMYPAITPLEALTLFARFYSRPRLPAEMLNLVGLEEVEHTRFRKLSGGQKQRLSLALALIGNPELVFLDEPTAGMDPQARHTTWGIISSLRTQGVTVLLTTHYMEEAETLCDRVALLNRGRLVAVGNPRDLIQAENPAVTLRTAEPADPEDIRTLPAATNVVVLEKGVYRIETGNPQALLVQMTARLNDAGVAIVQIQVGAESLEEVFLNLTHNDLPS